MEKILIINFDELSTKSKNKKMFIQQLLQNIKIKLQANNKFKYQIFHDHIEIGHYQLSEESNLVAKLTAVFGISNIKIATKFALDYQQLKTKIVSLILNDQANSQTFKLYVKRNLKTFPLNSQTITNELASLILQETNLTVDVKKPDLKINIVIKNCHIYYFTKQYEGAKGLPVGSTGKILLLISGGIDSPIVAYQLMKRGLEVTYLHFMTPPFTSDLTVLKVKQMIQTLSQYNNQKTDLYCCNFTDLQTEISYLSMPSYRIIIMRRMFIRIANLLAQELKITAIATGDALAQVVSQTLQSIATINNATTLPILRPLITKNKNEIIKIAKTIETYRIAISPGADCCALFVPKNPITQPKVAVAQKLEAKMNEIINLDYYLATMVAKILMEDKKASQTIVVNPSCQVIQRQSKIKE